MSDDLPTTTRYYKTAATHRQAIERLGSRVESVGSSTDRGRYIEVYDLDEFGQPPVFVCPCCGAEIE